MNTPQNAPAYSTRTKFEVVTEIHALQDQIAHLYTARAVLAAEALWSGLSWISLRIHLRDTLPDGSTLPDRREQDVFEERWTERLRPIIGDMRLLCEVERRSVPTDHLRALGLMR